MPEARPLFSHLFDDSAFLKDQYVPMKSANPSVPMLVRECKGVEPRIVCRFGLSCFSFFFLPLLSSLSFKIRGGNRRRALEISRVSRLEL